ncbi:RNA pyrophosphohydrolase [Rhodobacteraceae bacterium NNCM2]|nr:RNA pyrophosphohydrolase [Coraliihabitans acroporae]
MTEDEIDSLPYRPCVGLVILNNDRHIFAGQRIDNAMDAWQMPQGGIDKGESPVEAAMRELTEETGISPGSVKVLRESTEWHAYDLPRHLVSKLWKGRYRGQKQRWFALRFEGDDSEIVIDTDEPEFKCWAWMGEAELIRKIVPFKRDTYSRVFAEFQDLLD